MEKHHDNHDNVYIMIIMIMCTLNFFSPFHHINELSRSSVFQSLVNHSRVRYLIRDDAINACRRQFVYCILGKKVTTRPLCTYGSI